MQDSKLRSRLKVQLTKFSSELCVGLSRPLEKFVGQMLFGIQASQDMKLSNIARSLKEEIALIKTEDRLSRNLRSVELEAELAPRLAKMASQRITADTVLRLDLSDIRKEYAKKMEYLATVRDGSPGEMHPGYWLCDITGAEMNGSEIVPLYQKMYSAEAKEFVSENAEVLAGIDLVRSHTRARDLGCGSRWRPQETAGTLAGPAAAPCHPLHGEALLVDRKNMKRSVAELGAVAGCVIKHGSSRFRTGKRRSTICSTVSSGFDWWDATSRCTWWWSPDSERNRCYCSRMRWRERGTRNRSGGSCKST